MSDQWYLLKAQGNEIFGPAHIEQLQIWASGAKISPLDRVSSDDRKTWVRAPMVTQLQMDWLIEMTDGFLYGPTNVGTLQEFLAMGEIDEHTTVINTLDASTSRIGDLPFFKASPHRIRGTQEMAGVIADSEGVTDSVGALRQRVVWLERQVMELQRDAVRWEETCNSLRTQYIEATGREPR